MVNQDKSKSAADQRKAFDLDKDELSDAKPSSDPQVSADHLAPVPQQELSPIDPQDPDAPLHEQSANIGEAKSAIAEARVDAESTSESINDELKADSVHLSHHDSIPRNWARVWRQLAFSPLKHRWLDKAAHVRIEAAIKLAEEDHFGEIVMVIENTLPLWRSLRLDAHSRALEVFSSEHVWDTERNSGVLIYLCLSEQALEIVVDRGLHKAIDPIYWCAVCDKSLAGIKRGEPVRALEFLIRHVGKALKLFDQSGDDPSGNELSNLVIRL